MPIDPELLEILACPECKTPVEVVKDGAGLRCVRCHRVYPVQDDIPVMLVDEAKIDSQRMALEAALIQGVSRFRDPGRGQGLKGIRNYVSRWDGKIAIRSGTARIAIVPSWDDDVPLAEGLPPFPGSQVLLIIPEQRARHT